MDTKTSDSRGITAGAAEAPATPIKSARPWTRYLIVTLLVAFILGLGGREAYIRYIFVYEYDARVAGTLITISSRVAGWVTELPVAEGDTLKKGDTVVKIDDRDSKLIIRQLKAQQRALNAEQARLGAERELIDQQTYSRYVTQLSVLSASRAEVQSHKPQLDLAVKELVRARKLYQRKVIPKQVLDQAIADEQKLQSQGLMSQARHAESKAKLKEAKADRAELLVLDSQIVIIKAEIEELAVKIDQKKLDVADRTIKSSISGVVDRTFSDVGEYVLPGQRLLLVHDPSKIWVDANIKETEIRKVRIGQKVKVTVDAFPDKEFTGRVFAIGNAATSEFALLPTPNPSGNFTKITQRLRVRVRLEKTDKVLRPGTMAEIYIDIGRK
jgi:membrane fusion protein (multidrug efflux system)